jgi:hypothetical protein
MYEENKISSIVYEYYYNFIKIAKKKCAASTKIDEVEKILLFILDNVNNFNKEELKIVKNILYISQSIVDKTSNYKMLVVAKNNDCKILIKKINETLKEK